MSKCPGVAISEVKINSDSQLSMASHNMLTGFPQVVAANCVQATCALAHQGSWTLTLKMLCKRLIIVLQHLSMNYGF